MNVETHAVKDGKLIQVTISLSRRNLLALLQKIDAPTSDSVPYVWRLTNDDISLIVKAESDEEHYQDRNYKGVPLPAGQMTDGAEDFIKSHDKPLSWRVTP